MTQLDLTWSIKRPAYANARPLAGRMGLLRTAAALLFSVLSHTLQVCHTANGFHYLFLCPPHPRGKSQCLQTAKDISLGLQCRMTQLQAELCLCRGRGGWRRRGRNEFVSACWLHGSALAPQTACKVCKKCKVWALPQTYRIPCEVRV